MPRSNSPEPTELTSAQFEEVRRVAMVINHDPIPELTELSERLGVPFRLIGQAYGQIRSQYLPSIHERNGNFYKSWVERHPEWLATSAVAQVQARPGDIGVLPQNWTLIGARIQSGLSANDIAYQSGMPMKYYRELELGTRIPTPDQASRLCRLLGLSVRETFFVAAHPDAQSATLVRGLSFLQIMRARRRLSLKELLYQVHQATGVQVAPHVVRLLESGHPEKLKQHEKPQAIAIASYFGVAAHLIEAQVSPELFAQVAANTAKLHDIVQETMVSEHTLTPGQAAPHKLLEGSRE